MRCPLVPDIGIVSTLPTHPPASFAAGTTVRFTQGAVTTALGDVSPAAGWSLAWHVRGVGEADATVTDDGVRWTVSLPATATQALAAGGYTAVLRARRAGDALDLDVRPVTVTVNVASAVAGEMQAFAERTLAVLEASLLGDMSDAVQFYMIGDQQVNKMPLKERIALRNQLREEVQRERSGGVRATVTVGAFAARANPWA
jgi:hypothetical protein